MIIKKKELLSYGIACRVTGRTKLKLEELAKEANCTQSRVLVQLIEKAKLKAVK